VVNWHKYNESLVRRGEVLLLDFDVIDNWHSDLDGIMNEGKEGAAYRYPDSFVQLLGYMRVYFHLP
jgi:hypothetical protein